MLVNGKKLVKRQTMKEYEDDLVGKPGSKGTEVFKDHRIHLPEEYLSSGANKVVVRFVSNYVRDCEGLHYFKDTEDNEEYLYSQFEAFNAHIVFPCFDQPDLKAVYELLVYAPADWVVSSTSPNKEPAAKGSLEFNASTAFFELNAEIY